MRAPDLRPGIRAPWRGASTRRAAAVCVGFLTLAALACQRPPPAAPGRADTSDEPAVAVQTAPLRRGAIGQHVSAPGSVVARRESQIGAEVSGRIVRVHVSEGDRVAAGDPLFQIDPAPFAMALRQAQAVRDVARSERRQLQADLARATALRRDGILAAQELERLATSLAVAEARVRQADEAVSLAEHNLDRTFVRAPYAGSVAARLADEGTTALVQPQTIVVVLQETAVLEAHAAIAESQMALVRVGDPGEVHIEGADAPVQTAVAAVTDTIDPATRTYLVKLPVPNPDHRVKAGVFAHVDVRPRALADVVLAPRESIRVEDGRSRLLVVRDGLAEAIAVEVGAVDESDAEIRTGAGAGELAIIGDAARTIAPGMRVRVTGAADPPA